MKPTIGAGRGGCLVDPLASWYMRKDIAADMAVVIQRVNFVPMSTSRKSSSVLVARRVCEARVWHQGHESPSKTCDGEYVVLREDYKIAQNCRSLAEFFCKFLCQHGGCPPSQAVAGGCKRLRCPFLAKNPRLRAPRKVTMGCDPSTHMFSCALCHESSFHHIFILTKKTVFAPESNGCIGR